LIIPLKKSATGEAEQKIIKLSYEFLEWLSGFTDAEGNFSITLRKFSNNTYTSVMVTYQIGLHIDDLPILEHIKNNLNCGHISISGNKCNYFINDNYSLSEILLPIFNYSKLNSSKYYKFIIFEKAVKFINQKKHLSFFLRKQEGKLEMINFHSEIRKSHLAPTKGNLNNSPLSKYWLGGFTDGDASFSISNFKPRLKFENNIKEINLFYRIKEFFNIENKLVISRSRLNRPNSSETVNLDIMDISILKNLLVPLYSEDGILKTKKLKDFKDWSFLVLIYYNGYHLLPEGKVLIKEIKNN
jgi:hypothetical protein